jgi:trimeric autotransporter adhesin
MTTGSNNIDIGYNVGGVAGESNTIRIGDSDITAAFITGISGATSSGGAAVFVNSNGKLGTSTSSARFKEDIKPMGKASEAILALKPVSFRYKKEIDAQGISQFGLVAEDVEKVNPDLIIRDREGKPQTVRYEQVNAMLLNEFLKAHRKMEEQQKQIDALTAQLKEQAAQIQKVSAYVEVSKPAPEVVMDQPQLQEDGN